MPDLFADGVGAVDFVGCLTLCARMSVAPVSSMRAGNPP